MVKFLISMDHVYSILTFISNCCRENGKCRNIWESENRLEEVDWWDH